MDGGPSGVWDIQPATPGFVIATLTAVAVTWATPRPSEEIVALFDEVNGPRVSGAVAAAGGHQAGS